VRKNILFITGQFIPYAKSIGGVIRVYSFLQTLKKKYNVYLLADSGNYNGYLGLSKKNLDLVNIIYLKKKKISSTLYLFKNFIFFKILKNFLYLLSIDYSFSSSYFEKTLKIIESKKINYIIISGPPFSLFFLIKKIKKKFPYIKIIVDYRDSWTGRINNLSLLLVKKIVRNFIEKKILNYVEYILVATNNIKKNLSQITKKKIILITNGYINNFNNTKLTQRNSSRSKKILVGYFGLISDQSDGYRDIKILYNIFKNDLFLQNKYIFYFFGNNTISKTSIKNFSIFKFKKNIPYKNVLSVMRQMDYLLCLHTERNTSKEVITGKLYEYISSKRPIIFISAGDTEGGEIVKKYRLGYSINYLKMNLNFFFNNLKKNSMFIANKNISIFSRKVQNKKLLKIIN
jgi:hypothetical protein